MLFLCLILYTIYGAEPAGKAALAGKVFGQGREGWSLLPAGRFGRIPFRRGAETGDFLFWRPEARVIPGSGDKLPLFSGRALPLPPGETKGVPCPVRYRVRSGVRLHVRIGVPGAHETGL